MSSAAVEEPASSWKAHRLPFIVELCLIGIVLVGSLQSIVGIVGQLLSLGGIADYSSPFGPWIILWLAVVNALVAVPAFFDLVTVVFFGYADSTTELVLTVIAVACELAASGYMLHVLWRSATALVYLITTMLLSLSLLCMGAQSYRLRKCRQTEMNISTTTSILSEFPLEATSRTASLRSEITTLEEQAQVSARQEEDDAQPRGSVAPLVPTESAANGVSVVPRRTTRLPHAARTSITIVPLCIALVLHSFLCSQTYFLSSVSVDPVTDRRVTLYSYLDEGAQEERYITSINLRIVEPTFNEGPPQTRNVNCISLIVHDQGQDSTTLLPLARSLASADADGCLYVLIDRPGHGLSDAGKQATDLLTEGHILNNMALLLAAERVSGLQDVCGLRAEHNKDPGNSRLTDGRHIEPCFRQNGITAADIAERIRFTCIGHGTGTAACLAWAKIAARLTGILTLPVESVIGLDYFPQSILLEALYNQDVSATILQHEQRYLNLIKVCVAPFGLGGVVYNRGSGKDGSEDVLFLSTISPAVSPQELTRFNGRTSLCTFSEGYASTLSETASYDTQMISLDEFVAQNLSLPQTKLHLLILSNNVCTRGPSAVDCGLFVLDSERSEVLKTVTEKLAKELTTVTVDNYPGPPDDLWVSPREIAQWLLSRGASAETC